jgi:hypothetical protein
LVDARRGDAYPYDDDLALMDEPHYASRRITIVKKGFFFMFNRSSLKTLCAKEVGADKIQMIWLYNGGSGTVIFSDVRSAVTVKKELERRAKAVGTVNSVFDDLQVTFSKDPCHPDANLKFECDLADLNKD